MPRTFESHFLLLGLCDELSFAGLELVEEKGFESGV